MSVIVMQKTNESAEEVKAEFYDRLYSVSYYAGYSCEVFGERCQHPDQVQ